MINSKEVVVIKSNLSDDALMERDRLVYEPQQSFLVHDTASKLSAKLEKRFAEVVASTPNLSQFYPLVHAVV